MINNNMTIKIGGEAGQGVESSGSGFAKALSRGGLHLFALQDYMSRIRGGHNYFQIRVSEDPIYSHNEEVHLLLALNLETVKLGKSEIMPGGGIIYDEKLKVDVEDLETLKIKPFPVPLVNIAKEAGNKIMTNTALLGAAAGVTGYDFDKIASVIQDNFGKKGQDVVDANLDVARKAYDYAHEKYAADFEYKLTSVEAPPRMVLNGNQAIAMGALMGGCRFMSAYPMTPATSIFEWMNAHAAEYGIVTKHAEDEIAAINMAIGANHAGVRGMTATSGGGFSLMVEALGMAGITETPLVVVEVQRVGPSTGMPTRTEQADLLFIMYASQGEFPRIVLAPGTIEQCFLAGWQAFNLAEKYQCPVIILSDTFLANSLRTVDRSDLHFEDIVIDRGELLTDQELDKLSDKYKRYLVTDSGISPRALPGHPNSVHIASSDEHTEDGHIEDEDPENRIMMVEKRFRKMDQAVKEMKEPTLYGPPKADITFVGWGSTYGPIRETVDQMNQNGKKANFIHFTDLWPLPAEKFTSLLESAKHLVGVENNATGQFSLFLRTYTGILVDQQILRFDGQALSPEYILAKL